ncbi:MAG: hypothetical protein IJD79_03560 [Clostridia bacterium]|nr:hypothetical protein [Clostridia bacterium]
MNRNTKFYSLGWILLLGLFNLITFLIPALPDTEKYNASFWIGYSFITAALIGQFICAWFVLNAADVKKTFYNLPLVYVSYAGLVSTFAVGLVCMAVPAIPSWLAAILSSVILAVNVFALLNAKLASAHVEGVDRKIENVTSFIYKMREESEALLVRADDGAKAACVKVRDAFKFSDPVSSEALCDIEKDICEHFEAMKNAIDEDKTDAALAESEELLALIAERGSKCKNTK